VIPSASNIPATVSAETAAALARANGAAIQSIRRLCRIALARSDRCSQSINRCMSPASSACRIIRS
jgi:hypothetical protein